MSYNSAYREDDNSTMFSKRIAFTRTAINQISDAFPPSLPPPPPLSLLKTQKLQVEPANYGALDAILSGVLQTTATFKINITDLNNVIRMIFINGSSASGVARRVTLFIFGFNGDSIDFVLTSQYNQRSYQGSLFKINRNEMLSLGYRIETDGALSVFINGTRVNGGVFTEQNAPLAPIDSVQEFDVITNLECTLGDIAYYDVAKPDAFLEDVENYNINPTEPNLILGWREGTLIDVVNGIPMVIV